MNQSTQAVDQLLEESSPIINTQPELARHKAGEALRLSDALKYQQGRYESLFLLGRISNMFNACLEASQYFEHCAAIADKMADPKRKALAINATGVIYDNMLIHSKSIECFLHALDIAQASHIYDLEPKILNNISSVFSDLKDHKTALEYLLQAQQKAAGLNEPVGTYYRNIANIFLELGDYDQCRHYCLLARNAVWRERDAESHGDVYFILAAVFKKQGKLRKAFRYYHFGFRISERNHCFYSHAEACVDLARVFFEQKACDSALTYLGKALETCRTYEYHMLLKQVYKLLADVAHIMGDSVREIEALRQYTETSTMLEERENEKKRVYAKMQMSMFEMSKEHEHLKDQVHKDALTGCLNYRDFEGTLRKELNGLKGKAALFFLDVDNLKTINDKYGHSAGDQLIKEFASTLKEVVKGKGLVFRKGGDEFLAFLPYQKDEELHSFNEDLFSRLSRARIIGKTLTPISCSMGISLAPKDSIHPRELENMADKAMYEAKKMGKRCYCFYDSGALK